MIYIIIILYLLIGEGIFGALHESNFFISEDRYDHFLMMVGWLPFFVIAGVLSLYLKNFKGYS